MSFKFSLTISHSNPSHGFCTSWKIWHKSVSKSFTIAFWNILDIFKNYLQYFHFPTSPITEISSSQKQHIQHPALYLCSNSFWYHKSLLTLSAKTPCFSFKPDWNLPPSRNLPKATRIHFKVYYLFILCILNSIFMPQSSLQPCTSQNCKHT